MLGKSGLWLLPLLKPSKKEFVWLAKLVGIKTKVKFNNEVSTKESKAKEWTEIWFYQQVSSTGTNYVRSISVLLPPKKTMEKKIQKKNCPIYLNEYFLSRICSFGVQQVMVFSS